MSKHSTSKRGGWRLRREADGGFFFEGNRVRFVPGRIVTMAIEDKARLLLTCIMQGHHYHSSYPAHWVCLRCGAVDMPIATAVNAIRFNL
jgi:hypothetical protein